MTTAWRRITSVNNGWWIQGGTMRVWQSGRFRIGSEFTARVHIQGRFMKKKLMLMVLLVGIVTTAVVYSRTLHAQSAPRRIEVVAKRFAFEPGEITLKKGEPVVLVLKSTDVAHGLRFRELNLD